MNSEFKPYKVIVNPAANNRMHDHFKFLAYLKNEKYRYMVSCNRYRIVYQIEDCTVFVEDIQDCRQSGSRNLL